MTKPQQTKLLPIRIYLTKGIGGIEWGGTDFNMVEGFAELTANCTGKPALIDAIDITSRHARKVFSTIHPRKGSKPASVKRQRAKVA